MDGRHEIILANWPNDKHIICNINNDIVLNLRKLTAVSKSLSKFKNKYSGIEKII